MVRGLNHWTRRHSAPVGNILGLANKMGGTADQPGPELSNQSFRSPRSVLLGSLCRQQIMPIANLRLELQIHVDRLTDQFQPRRGKSNGLQRIYQSIRQLAQCA